MSEALDAATHRIIAKCYDVPLSQVTTEFKRAAIMAHKVMTRLSRTHTENVIREKIERKVSRTRSDDFRRGAEAELQALARTRLDRPVGSMYPFMERSVTLADYPLLGKLHLLKL